MQYNSQTGFYEAREDGKLVQVDADVFAEEVKRGVPEQELLNPTTWTGSTPMDGVYIDGVNQNAQKGI